MYKLISNILAFCFIVVCFIKGEFLIGALLVTLCCMFYFRRRPTFPDMKENETIREYRQRKAEEHYSQSILEMRHKLEEDTIPLIQRYGARHVKEVLDHIHKGELWCGAHKKEVERILGEPYEIQYKDYTEDWSYEPSKNAKRFGKRIKFKGDRVHDFRI